MRYLCSLMSCMAAWAMFFSAAAYSQEPVGAFPSKPVVLVLPAAAGGPTDAEARLYATKISSFMGQSFVLDYKPGAGTTIGTAYVAKAAPDGYTMLIITAGFTVFPAFYKDLPFDSIKDFAPVSLLSQRTTVLLATPSFPAKNIMEYLAYAKANPGKINFGTAGAGSSVHLAGEWLHGMTNTKATFVHYKGTGPLLPDLFAGRVDMTASTLLGFLPLIKSGKLRALAIMNEERSKLLPGLQTIAEQGVPGYNYSNWLGFVAPAATPAAIVSKLNEGFARVAKAPDVIASLEADGISPVGSTIVQFRQIIVTETERWRKVVQDNGIKLVQ